MPGIEQMELNQQAVYWAVSDLVTNYGQNKVEAPIEINVRWENFSQSNRGSETQVTAIVANITSDRLLAVNSILWKGRLVDYIGSDQQNASLCEVQKSGEVFDINGREVRYETSLSRYKGELAVIEPGTGS